MKKAKVPRINLPYASNVASYFGDQGAGQGNSFLGRMFAGGNRTSVSSNFAGGSRGAGDGAGFIQTGLAPFLKAQASPPKAGNK